MNCSPAPVSVAPDLLRTKRRRPSSSSSVCTRTLTAVCVTCSRAAARTKLPHAAISRKVRASVMSIAQVSNNMDSKTNKFRFTSSCAAPRMAACASSSSPCSSPPRSPPAASGRRAPIPSRGTITTASRCRRRCAIALSNKVDSDDLQAARPALRDSCARARHLVGDAQAAPRRSSPRLRRQAESTGERHGARGPHARAHRAARFGRDFQQRRAGLEPRVLLAVARAGARAGGTPVQPRARFSDELKSAAAAFFGSGWIWLVDDHGTLGVAATANADNPLRRGLKPLLVVDIWEHAYYLDHQNRRDAYVDGVVDRLLNWDFAERSLAQGALHAA